MEKLFSFKSLSSVLSTIFVVSTVMAEDKPDATFRLKRGVGACSNLPTEADNFVCNAVGWPDQNARVDLVRQEFVNKYGMTVRWGLFDYYYYFTGIKKCEAHKDTIVNYLAGRRDLDELWQKLGKSADCVRKGQGWIQTRNIELFSGEPFVPDKRPTMEVKLVPAKKSAQAPKESMPVATLKHKEPRKVANVESAKSKKMKAKYEDEEPMTSVPMAPLKREPVKAFWSEPFPKEFF